ncbi:Spy/CpxP family protein refolding chaperone [Aquabacterium sp. A7-Y]|uniref:Spy/CpxP family protein refolding chaperone n=1 Tax=Aquabacterium sp. A7-Y TaxID=1349605 RepID=UPI00223DF457|nr:Spy/CpxP family protein refolding chaperone [Aquabacterium sp. A7-Y]MCW7538702.1 Spy/CpxP family protein refolding chaperone [Aquabacterium sp. A7-Y]
MTELKTPASAAVRRRSFKGLAMGLVLGLAAAAAVPVLAHGHGHHGGGAIGMPGAFMGSPERVERMVDRLLKDLNATDAQRAQVKQIALAAAADLKTQREAGRALRQQSLQLFAQPTVDANAVEALRQQQMAHADQVSRRISLAMIEVSRVLTPEQRAQLAERMKQRAERWKERHAGRVAQPGQPQQPQQPQQ